MWLGLGAVVLVGAGFASTSPWADAVSPPKDPLALEPSNELVVRAEPETEPETEPEIEIEIETAELVDPLSQRSLWPVADDEENDDWLGRPTRGTQYSLTRDDRRVNPCEAPDPGFGVLADWVHVRPMGQFVAPRLGTLSEDGHFDLVVHFHGHRPARKELARSGEDLVLLGVSLGIGAAYGPPFSDPMLFEKLVSEVETKIAAGAAVPSAEVRRIALTSWSRGYEAIEHILVQPLGRKVDALVLLDSLHASRDRARQEEQLARFVRFARRAVDGEKFFFASHSSIDPPDYASTTETVHSLLNQLGYRPRPARRRDPLGLDLIEWFSKGDFHVRGYSGNGKLDHCAHFGVFPDALRALGSRWQRSTGQDPAPPSE